ncbi:MAG TPA: cation:proton antiporter, partial [Stenomitos sp.]
MPETSLFADLTIALVAALLGGLIATRLRLPVILGYLVSGVLIGPHGLAWIRDSAQIDRLALIGVVFLMFALGVEFSLADLKPVWRVSLLGGTFQILATILIVTVGLYAFGLSIPSDVAIGCVLSLSSTALVMRLLTDRGDVDAAYGRVLTGILIVQDLAVLPMVLVIPGLSGTGIASYGFVRDLALGLAFVAVALGFGARIVPRVMAFIASMGSKELFFLTVLAMGFGLSLIAQAFGVSTAIGAFLAGLVISESPHSKQALAEILPLRGLFATVFFVSLGMLFDPHLALSNAPAILWLILSIVVGKT